MTNEQIIEGAKAANGINEDCHTFAEWKRLGKVVRKGEKAAFKASIWKLTSDIVEVREDVFEKKERFVLRNASFFAESQVQAIGGAAC